MSRLFYHVMQDNSGNLLFDVSGTMRLAGSGTLATIYGDEALTIPIANPMTNHPSFGSFKCYLGPGSYDFYMAKSGYTFETLTGVQGLGTLANQNANSVAITGGSGDFDSLSVTPPPGAGYVGIYSNMSLADGAGRVALSLSGDAPAIIAAPLTVAGKVVIGATFSTVGKVEIRWDKTSGHGISMIHNNDAGGGFTQQFLNSTGVQVGSISQTGSATAFNTTSDGRLKHAISPLTGALGVVRALRPVSFLWNADGSPGRGFLAHEVADVVDGVITGERDAVDEGGNIVPQQIDPSKLVVWLIGACQDLAAQVEALTARLEAAGA